MTLNWISFALVLVPSLFLLPHSMGAWTPVIPVVFAALPFSARRPWVRVVAAALLLLWIVTTYTGFLHVPGLIVALTAVVKDGRAEATRAAATRALAALVAAFAALSVYPPRYLYPQLLDPRVMTGGWRLSPGFRQAMRAGRIRVRAWEADQRGGGVRWWGAGSPAAMRGGP